MHRNCPGKPRTISEHASAFVVTFIKALLEAIPIPGAFLTAILGNILASPLAIVCVWFRQHMPWRTGALDALAVVHHDANTIVKLPSGSQGSGGCGAVAGAAARGRGRRGCRCRWGCRWDVQQMHAGLDRLSFIEHGIFLLLAGGHHPFPLDV
jgi:hypothetical protein